MAVEEEGLRVFQSVKIKIGKAEGWGEKSLPPVCAHSMDGSMLTGRTAGKCGQAGSASWRLKQDKIRLVPVVLVIQITRLPPHHSSKVGERRGIESRFIALWEIWGILAAGIRETGVWIFSAYGDSAKPERHIKKAPQLHIPRCPPVFFFTLSLSVCARLSHSLPLSCSHSDQITQNLYYTLTASITRLGSSNASPPLFSPQPPFPLRNRFMLHCLGIDC